MSSIWRSAVLPLTALVVVTACQSIEERVQEEAEALDPAVPVVTPAVETAPVPSIGDAADDAVVLVSDDGTSAWIAATDKQFGLLVYDLEGNEVASLDTGRLNNVDAVRIDDDEFMLAASNRSTAAIELFLANIRDGAIDLSHVTSVPLALLDPYGLCIAELDGSISVFVGNRAGRVEEWIIDDEDFGSMGRVIVLPNQTEGCVVDVEDNLIFIGEEDVGIWSIDLASMDQVLVDQVGDGRLTADVEGLDIYDGGSGRFLIASSQGSNSFAIYRLPGVEPAGVFQVGPNAERGTDGASETDGVAVTSRAIPGFPMGILVVQDGYNLSPDENQNFKIVDWREIEAVLGL